MKKTLMTTAIMLLFIAGLFAQKNEKPNILVIWGDDIGQSNISAYTMGLVGYKTPNIDRIAREGMIFYRLLCRTKLYSRSFFLYYRAKCIPYWS